MGFSVINTYHNNFSGGVGDFLRGSIYLFEKCKELGTEFAIDWQYHELGRHIKSNFNKFYSLDNLIDIEKTALLKQNRQPKYDLGQHMNHTLETVFEHISQYPLTNHLVLSSFFLDMYKKSDTLQYVRDYNISKECKCFLRSNITFNKNVEDLFSHYELPNTSYAVLHFRLGDRHSLPDLQNIDDDILNNYNLQERNYDYDFLYFLIQQNIKKYSLQNIIIMSDSNDFKAYIESQNNTKIMCLHQHSQHTSLKPGLLNYSAYESDHHNPDTMIYTALDLKVLTKSLLNITYSCYQWGSGFVVWPSKIYDIPLEVYRLVNNKISV